MSDVIRSEVFVSILVRGWKKNEKNLPAPIAVDCDFFFPAAFSRGSRRFGRLVTIYHRGPVFGRGVRVMTVRGKDGRQGTENERVENSSRKKARFS